MNSIKYALVFFFSNKSLLLHMLDLHQLFQDSNQPNSQCLCKSISQIDDGKSLECTSIKII
ncbi:hypothetical protein pb186bvf_021101 [Paramecium bursaria]